MAIARIDYQMYAFQGSRGFSLYVLGVENEPGKRVIIIGAITCTR